MTNSLSEEKPCPGGILTDVGGGFAMGAVGGSAYHFAKGLRASPNGARFTGGMQALRMNGPRIGGLFAVWGGLFCTFNCTAVYVRQKEDPWNSIVAAAATGGLLSVRRGLRAAGRSALFSGAFFALFEGMGVLLTQRVQAEQAEQNGPQVDNSKLFAAAANRLHAAQQNFSPVDDPNSSTAVGNHVHAAQQNLAAGVANRLHAAQQNLPPVDNPGIASGGDEEAK